MLEPRSSASRVLLVSSVCCCVYLQNCTSFHISTIGLLSAARQAVCLICNTAAVTQTREYHRAAFYAISTECFSTMWVRVTIGTYMHTAFSHDDYFTALPFIWISEQGIQRREFLYKYIRQAIAVLRQQLLKLMIYEQRNVKNLLKNMVQRINLLQDDIRAHCTKLWKKYRKKHMIAGGLHYSKKCFFFKFLFVVCIGR